MLHTSQHCQCQSSPSSHSSTSSLFVASLATTVTQPPNTTLRQCSSLDLTPTPLQPLPPPPNPYHFRRSLPRGSIVEEERRMRLSFASARCSMVSSSMAYQGDDHLCIAEGHQRALVTLIGARPNHDGGLRIQLQRL